MGTIRQEFEHDPHSCKTNANGRRPLLLDPNALFWQERAPATFRACFKTTQGEFVVEAYRDWAPHGVDRFHNLVRSGFFDDSRFFRVRAGYIAQFGIPGDPTVSSVWRDSTISDDLRQTSNTRGTFAFAMQGPNDRRTQIFINLADNPRNDNDGFAVLGCVMEGMDVIDRLYAGYGEDAGGGMRAGKQDLLFSEGNAYLDLNFPRLDRILRAQVLNAGPHPINRYP